MVEGEGRIKVSAVLPWFVCLILVLALIFVIVRHRGGESGIYETLIRENEILSAMRLNLLRAAEAEKSAVLAVTDEESQKFADQARLAADDVDKARKYLAPLIEQDNSALEATRIGEFDRCWTEFRKLDRLILDLAVQNTNLHAANLALTKGAQAVKHLERSLADLTATGLPDDGNGRGRITRLSYQALVAGLKIHDLFAPHIDAETDEQMDEIEKDIEADRKVLANSLDELAGIVKGGELDTVNEARAANSELVKVTNEIITLSRENTNIKSLELSLGKKRLITAQCDEILSAFEELLRARGSRATR